MLINIPRAEAILRERKMDALLASTLHNVFYLSGFWNENVFITPRTAQAYALAVKDDLAAPTVLTGVGDAAAAFTVCPPRSRFVFFGSFFRYTAPGVLLEPIERRVADQSGEIDIKPNSLEALAAALKQCGLTRGVVGYDERGVGDSLLAGLRQYLPQVDFRPADAVFLSIRAVKTEEELRRLQAAVALTEAAVRAAVKMAQPGVTESEMVREFNRTIVSGGGHPLFTMIYFGRRGSLGQQPVLNGVLRHGDIIRFDVGCVLNGYCSDIARNFAVGDPGGRLRRLHAITVEAEDAALDALRPGAKASQVFQAGVEAARAAGIPEYRRHHIGHGVGLEVYETPLLGPGDHTVIEEGMTFEVETPYYEIGSAGLQPEDTVVVTQTRPRLLTTLPRELVVIE
ncbi:MAG: Xaa-Pro peptidase family protein [Armatimonadota bacterium]|nr:Xaa-Pro peptidase family protein [Armatimonadota bacterium]